MVAVVKDTMGVIRSDEWQRCKRPLVCDIRKSAVTQGEGEV